MPGAATREAPGIVVFGGGLAVLVAEKVRPSTD